jgi:hypothetical protein
MNSIGILVFFTIVLVTASFTSLTVAGPQQAIAKSSNSVMKSLIANTTKIGVLSIPITCNSVGDIIGALSGVIGNATAAGRGNETNSTQGMGNLMKALSGMLGNTTAGGGNETRSMQGMMTSGMQNMSQLQHLKNVIFCNLANEKTIRSMMK